MIEKYHFSPNDNEDAESLPLPNVSEIDRLAASGLHKILHSTSNEHLSTNFNNANINDGLNINNNHNINDNYNPNDNQTNDEDNNTDHDYDDDYNDDDDDYDGWEEESAYTDAERIELKNEQLNIQHITLPETILQKYDFIKELPSNIGIMGGVARSIAREIVANEYEPIRDIDLVNILNEDGTSQNSDNTIDALSQEFMPDDHAFGHGMQSETLEHYFQTRDFTINECLILNGQLLLSDSAYNDLQENIIRPTYYELPYATDDLSSRLFLKALMMRSVLSHVTSSIPLLEDVHTDPYKIRAFDIALTLNKTMGRGVAVARTFTQDLADWDLIPENLADKPKATAQYILQQTYNFTFRPTSSQNSVSDSDFTNIDYIIPASVDLNHGTTAQTRQILSEYDDFSSLPDQSLGEKISGMYTQSDYDEINAILNHPNLDNPRRHI